MGDHCCDCEGFHELELNVVDEQLVEEDRLLALGRKDDAHTLRASSVVGAYNSSCRN